MKLTVASLSRRPDLGLTLLAAAETAEVTPVEWAHAIDRVDSDKWIAPGTFVMTAGYQFPDDAQGQAQQIEALRRAGACAVAVDTGGRWETVPRALIDYGEEVGFPVLAIAAEIPLTNVVRAVAEDITAARVRQLTDLIAAQNDLVSLLLREGLEAVARQLSNALDAVVVVTDNYGVRLVEEAPATTDRARQDIFDVVTPAPPYSPQVGRSVLYPRGNRVVSPLNGAFVRQGALVVDASRYFDESDRLLISFAAAIISLSTSRSLAVHEAEERLRQQALASILAGETPDASRLSLFGLRPDTQVTALFLTGVAARKLDSIRLSEELHGLGWKFLYAPRPKQNGFAIVIAGDLSAGAKHPGVESLYQKIRRVHPNARIGIGGAMPLVDVPLSVNQAEVAVPKDPSAGPVRAIGDMPAHDLILGAIADTNALELLTGGAFRKLREYDQRNGTNLLAAAKAFIDANGRYDPMARTLGIHRQTAKARALQVEDVLGKHLDDPDLRAELWLAFKASHFRN
nr:helix-turn-helix domain-containing protein [Corynebacterium lactis]